jgi:transcriptional regulator with XRE-family HTH domain
LDEQGRKQVWLAEECRISPNYITLILNGARDPSASTVKLIALALGVTEEDLLKAS